MCQIWHKRSSRGQISSKFSRPFSQVPKTPNKYLSTSKAIFNPEKNLKDLIFTEKVVFIARDVTKR